MRLRKAAHTTYKTQYHIVWVTRYRRKILTKGVQAYLRIIFKEINTHFPDWEFEEIGMEPDHIHIHMIIPPKYSVSYVVETLKKNTAKRLKQKFTFLENVYWDKGKVWTRGFFVSTVGINESIIKNYVRQQGQEDCGQAKLAL